LDQAHELRQIMWSGTPFWLYVGMPKVRGDWDVKMLATLRGVSTEERAGEPDALYTEVQFTEYRQAKLTRKARGKGPREKKRTVVITHKGGDTRVRGLALKRAPTLANIARVAYGSPSEWKSIASANHLKGIEGSTPLGEYMADKHKTEL